VPVKIPLRGLVITLAVSNVTIIKDIISRWLVSGNDALSAICKEVLVSLLVFKRKITVKSYNY